MDSWKLAWDMAMLLLFVCTAFHFLLEFSNKKLWEGLIVVAALAMVLLAVLAPVGAQYATHTAISLATCLVLYETLRFYRWFVRK